MLFQAVLQAKVHGTFGLLPSSSKAKAQASLLEPFWPKLCTVEINRTSIASLVTAEKLWNISKDDFCRIFQPLCFWLKLFHLFIWNFCKTCETSLQDIVWIWNFEENWRRKVVQVVWSKFIAHASSYAKSVYWGLLDAKKDRFLASGREVLVRSNLFERDLKNSIVSFFLK